MRKGGEKSSFRVLSPLLVVVFVREEVVALSGFLVEIYTSKPRANALSSKGIRREVHYVIGAIRVIGKVPRALQ